MDLCKRSQVQGSTFRVNDKGKIKDPEFLRQMLVLPDCCQGNTRFQKGMINVSLIYVSKMHFGSQLKSSIPNPQISEPFNREPLNP